MRGRAENLRGPKGQGAGTPPRARPLRTIERPIIQCPPRNWRRRAGLERMSLLDVLLSPKRCRSLKGGGTPLPAAALGRVSFDSSPQGLIPATSSPGYSVPGGTRRGRRAERQRAFERVFAASRNGSSPPPPTAAPSGTAVRSSTFDFSRPHEELLALLHHWRSSPPA